MIVPKLRFSEFKDCWKEKTIFEIAENNSLANGVFNDKNKVGKGYKLINVLDMYLERDINETKLTLLDLDKNEFERNKVQYGDIFFTRSSLVKEGIAHSNVYLGYSEDITYDGHLIKLSPNQNLFNSIFLNYNFKTANVRNQLIKGGKTATMTTIGQQEVGNTKIFFPTKKEQTKIAEFLSAVDDKISQLSRQLELLNQYKKGVMQKIFSQEIRFKNDNGEDFGEWEKVKFSDIFIEIKDKVGNKNIETYSITAGKGFVSQSEKFGRDISGSQNENYIVLGKNDFSYNKGNSKTYKFGCVYLNNTGQNIAVPNVFISFRAKKNNIAHNFYAKLFEHHYLDRYLRQLISSSARMDGLLNISKEGFFEIPLPFPPTPEQEKIAEFLTAIDERIDHTTAQLTQTKQWKKGLLQQMFV